jgi:hypothetical protein
MKRSLTAVAVLALGLIAWAGQTWASSKIDTYIQQLKDVDPKVRAIAADKLGCG